MPSYRHLSVVVALGSLVMGAALSASGPTFWTVATSSDFLRGTSDGAFVSSTGVVTAGPQLTNRLTSTPGQVWSLVQAPDGALWAGTGSDGRVLRLRPGQAEQTVFDADEANIFALAVAGTRVYAASSPDGRVYAIENDVARPFFDPEEKYIWALAVDRQNRLWIGAGNPAAIYRVDANGAGTVIYRPPAGHVVSLGADSAGRILAGTESPGRLYRLDADDRRFVMLDTGLAEVRAIASGADGVTFVAALARGDNAASDGETTSVTLTLTPPAAPSDAGAPGTSTAAARRSVLYRIDPSGTWEDIWNTPDLIYDIAAQPDGAVLVATGPDGRLYRVERGRDVLLYTGVDARQVTRFAAGGAPGALTAFATANPGRIVAIGGGEQSPATYYSPVRDTRSVSTWGLARWEATGTVALYARSGNTPTPDESWSEWSGPYTRREGDVITSPPARFLQWRAVLTTPAATPSATLSAVTIAYLTRNSRPIVSSVTVHPPGVVFQRLFTSDDTAIAGLDSAIAAARRPAGDNNAPSPTSGRRMFRKGLQTLTWRADDSDDDELTYGLQYRREGETAWRDLASGLTDAIYVWDTTAVADGRYVVRVRAADDTTNAADRTLTGERDSDSIDIDNTPPTLTVQVVRQPTGALLRVQVTDARSPILRVEYAVGGGPWRLVHPADGLADAPQERYEIPLAADIDPNRIVIRATDFLQNVMSQAVTSP
jgi:hypothetical protein